MRLRLLTACIFSVALLGLAAWSSPSLAQDNDQDISGANGVIIDAEGVLRLQHYPDPGGRLAKKRVAQARANLNPDVARPSALRKVSLNRLEAAIAKQLADGQAPTEEMQFLAGLTRIQYVFYYPETKDIVVAGPAEGWALDAANHMCGIQSGLPVIQLQDLIVALRAYPPQGRQTPAILVSIDPTPEGLAKMQDFLRRIRGNLRPSDAQMIVNGLRTNLGMQNIRIDGVAPNTHFAQVLLECDYRMKLIGLGMEKPPVRMASYVDRATASANNALERWYFIPDYQCARVAADQLGLELVGDTVKLVSENQVVAGDGSRAVSGKSNRASELFTTTFTKKYAELSAKLPVFAEMRNMIDLAIAAAFISQQNFYAESGWQADLFHDESRLAVETENTPKQVETVCTAVWKGGRLFTPVGGGVTIHPREALQAGNVLADEDGKISTVRQSVDLKDLPADRWWWD
ncbi:MAG: DUF1598 domain-containing protein [Planctomycetota bacterium]|nr:MAG: DUF1598 domain-containing protein [Planctomycetota bacterium]